MKHLFLIRHAKSSWKHPDLRDHDRPLKSRGRRQLDLMRDVIQAEGAFDGPVFCSTARRARLTVEGLLAGAVQPRLEFDPGLYTFDYRDLLDWLARRDEDRITLVGHNPALEDLVHHLLPEPLGHLPTCAFVHIALPADDWHEPGATPGRLLSFATPKSVGK